MRVILYYPPVTPETVFPTWEPLQLIHLSRMLRDSDIETVIIDGRLGDAGTRKNMIADALSGGGVLCFGITSLTCYQLSEALCAADLVKELNPDIPVLFGGWHATAFFDETIREEAVDIVVRGQGEITFREVVDRIRTGRDVSGVRGISWKKEGAVIHEEDRPLVSPDEFPELLPSDFEVLDLSRYQLNSMLFYMSSVGCPYACAYCSVSSACRRKWLPLSAGRMLREIGALQDRFSFREMIFWDNVFFIDRKRVEEMCRGFLGDGISLKWSAHARINEVIRWDDSFISLIKESGCKSIFIGAESASQRLLNIINKQIKADDILPAFAKLRRHGIDIAVNWMVGFPDEGYEDISQTVRCIRDGLALYDYDIERFRVFIYRFVPFPGTPVFDSLPGEITGKMPSTARQWGDYIFAKINDGMEPWREENGPSLFASSTFYLWKAYLQRESASSGYGKLLKLASKTRVDSGMLRFPLEWHIWKKRQEGKR